MSHRKPHNANHATASNGAIDRKAVAAEMRHVADLLDAGKIDLREMHQIELSDGWQRLMVDRKLGSDLV